MDGNGRWAAAAEMPRRAGHKAGLSPGAHVHPGVHGRAVSRRSRCSHSPVRTGRGRRKKSSASMGLFVEALDRESTSCTRNGVRLRFIGDRQRLSVRLQARSGRGRAAHGRPTTGLQLQIAMSYGGRWDIVQAAQAAGRQCASGALRPADIDEERFAAALALADAAGRGSVRSAPAASTASAISCCGTAPTPSCTSPTACGRTSTMADFEAALAFFAAASGASGDSARHNARRR